MAWDRRGYYYRKKRIGPRVVSEYVGRGIFADFAAGEVERDQVQRQQQRAEWQRQRAASDAIDAGISNLDELVSGLMAQELTAAGYHQHERGEWRKQRGS